MTVSNRLADDDECPHGMPDPAWCSTCKHGPTIHPPVEPVATFTARFTSRCASCDEPMHEGDRITKWSDDTYTHEGCEQ